MRDRNLLILIPTALGVMAIAVLVIGQLTYPWRATAAGVVLALCSGALIWFAKTRRHAIARALFSIGATAIVAPVGGLFAAQNDFLYNFLSDDGFDDSRFDAYEQAMAISIPILGIGAAIAVVLFFVGWRLHRSPPSA
jgi:NADH:ubiquinone oxidoreductase subunit 5 (subunit L)/multisubunit Na+/H+ antiporter MnhA subunit